MPFIILINQISLLRSGTALLSLLTRLNHSFLSPQKEALLLGWYLWSQFLSVCYLFNYICIFIFNIENWHDSSKWLFDILCITFTQKRCRLKSCRFISIYIWINYISRVRCVCDRNSKRIGEKWRKQIRKIKNSWQCR